MDVYIRRLLEETYITGRIERDMQDIRRDIQRDTWKKTGLDICGRSLGGTHRETHGGTYVAVMV